MNSRPTTLKEVAERSEIIADFGRHLRDWLHELRSVSSGARAFATIAEEPPLLRKKFTDGAVADAWLAAYAEHLAIAIERSAPAWAFGRSRTADEPVFDPFADSPALRAIALARSPLAFKRRNLFTLTVDLPLRLRRGRPEKSAEEKRRSNAERQRRFRELRRQELLRLRKLHSLSSGRQGRL